jgi:hypothetical protein
MKGTYIAVIIMTLVVAVAVGYGFWVMGSPWAIRGYKLDATRMTDFSEIQNITQDYYDTKYSLPDSLATLASSSYGVYYAEQNVFTDPDTQAFYDYKTTGSTSYQLCATFAASSQDEANYNGSSLLYLGTGEAQQHSKGYDCITYSVTGVQNPYSPDNYFFGASSTVASTTYGY